MPPPLPLTSPNILQSLPLFKACSREGINNRTWYTRKHQPWRPKSDLDAWKCSRNKSSRRNRNSVASCCLSLRNMASSMPSEWNRCLKQSNTVLNTFHVWQRWSSCWPSCLPYPHYKRYSYNTSTSDFTDLPCSSQKLPSAGGLWTLWLLSVHSIAIRPLECHPLSVSFFCIPCPSYSVWLSHSCSIVLCQVIKSVMSDEGAVQALCVTMSVYFPSQFCHSVKCCYLVLYNALLVLPKYTLMS